MADKRGDDRDGLRVAAACALELCLHRRGGGGVDEDVGAVVPVGPVERVREDVAHLPRDGGAGEDPLEAVGEHDGLGASEVVIDERLPYQHPGMHRGVVVEDDR